MKSKNSKGSKIAAFLPMRQLWNWLGKAYRKAGVRGRARKHFYKTIKRGKEAITVSVERGVKNVDIIEIKVLFNEIFNAEQKL